jgi:hypothetical protein
VAAAAVDPPRKVSSAAACRPVPRDRAVAAEGVGPGTSSDSKEEEDPGTAKHEGCTGDAIVGRNDGGSRESWQSGGVAALVNCRGMMEGGWAKR